MEVEHHEPVEDSQLIKWLTLHLNKRISDKQVSADETTSIYLDRQDVLSLSRLITVFFSEEQIPHSDKNYAVTIGLIEGHRRGEEITAEEALDYLKECAFLFRHQ